MRIYIKEIMIAAVALSFIACSDDTVDIGSDGINALVDVVPVAAGETCAEGGYSINTGTDLNENDVLDGDEVTSTSTICNGETGTTGETGTDGAVGADATGALVETTTFAAGSEECEFGGVLVSVGVDNGDGGGTADDGILQAGELDDSNLLCDSDPLLIEAMPMTPPDGPAGAFTINIEGGDGSVGEGGQGGYVLMELNLGTMGGHNKIFNTGVADASFEMPAAPEIYLGVEPLVIETSMTIKTYTIATHAQVQNGEIHTHQTAEGDSGIYIWNQSTNSEVRVTGLEIKAGAAVTLEDNKGDEGDPGVYFYLENDFHNAGTVSTVFADGTLDRIRLFFKADIYYGAPGSSVVLSGGDATSGNAGGNGGDFKLKTQNSNHNMAKVGGLIVSYSTVDTTGGNGDSGGTGGLIRIEASQGVYNAGNIDASGGLGAIGTGGDSSRIYLISGYGDCQNSAQLTSNGGSGATFGGNSGGIYLGPNDSGNVRNRGEIEANGGNSAATCSASCIGGSGGSITIEAWGGEAVSLAPVSARGGFGAAGLGGTGGAFEVDSEYTSGWYGTYQPAGDLIISGDIDLSGGDGASGGPAGYIQTSIDGDDIPQQQEIIFLGYTDIYADGGDSETWGGDGGYLEMFNEYSDPDYGDEGPSGGNINYANLHASGGNSTSGPGGYGGFLYMETDDDYGFMTEGEVALNYGQLTLDGGDGAIITGGDGSGSRGGWVFMWGYNRAENHGDISAKGGTYSGEDTTIARAPEEGIQILSDLGPVINTGDIDIRGVNASGANSIGGESNFLEMVGTSAMNSGAINISGGQSTGTGGTGGDSDFVFIYGHEEGATNTGTFIIDGGTGDTVGAHGEVVIDGMNMTEIWVTP